MTGDPRYYLKTWSGGESSKPGECRYCGAGVEDGAACPACIADMMGGKDAAKDKR
jgi:hypothetical protein